MGKKVLKFPLTIKIVTSKDLKKNTFKFKDLVLEDADQMIAAFKLSEEHRACFYAQSNYLRDELRTAQEKVDREETWKRAFEAKKAEFEKMDAYKQGVRDAAGAGHPWGH